MHRNIRTDKKRYKCICCGYFTLSGSKQEDVSWDICPVCFWENDVFEDDENAYSGANHMTLKQGRTNYKKFGACEEKALEHVRKPKACEYPKNNEVL